MSKAQLKKTISHMLPEQLQQLILEAYDARKETKEYLEFWLNPDPKTFTDKYKQKLHDVFYSKMGKARSKPKLSEGNKLIRDYMGTCFATENVADLLLYYAETECQWIKTRWRRTSYLASIRKNVDTARIFIENSDLEDQYGERLRRLSESLKSLFPYLNFS